MSRTNFVLALSAIVGVCVAIGGLAAGTQGWPRLRTLPTPGTTLPQEIQCYALPYGGLGFLSHILTYYTTVMTGLGRMPLPPFSHLKHPRWDMFTNIASVVISVTWAGLVMKACLNHWQFMLIAFWKLTLALTINAVGIASAMIRINKYWETEFELDEMARSFFAMVIYGVGAIIGSVGLFSVVKETFGEITGVRITTYVLVGILALTLVTNYISVCLSEPRAVMLPFAIVCALFLILLVFSSDWVLGAVAGDYGGVPSSTARFLH